MICPRVENCFLASLLDNKNLQNFRIRYLFSIWTQWQFEKTELISKQTEDQELSVNSIFFELRKSRLLAWLSWELTGKRNDKNETESADFLLVLWLWSNRARAQKKRKLVKVRRMPLGNPTYSFKFEKKNAFGLI